MKNNNAYLSGSKGGYDRGLTRANETNMFNISIMILDSAKPILQ